MGEHHHAGHGHAPANFDRAFAIGIALNLAFVGIEAFYGWRINSLALLADAGHNLSDVAGLVLAWAGAAAGRLHPTPMHTYGWKKASTLAAFLNAMLLLGAVVALAWEAGSRLWAPNPSTSDQGWTMMAVAAVGIVVNSVTAWLFMRGGKDDLNVRGAFMHMAADALVSLGVVLAGALTLWVGWVWLDPVISLLIVGVISVGSWGLMRESFNQLCDGVPSHLDPAEVRACLLEQRGVVSVPDMRLWALSTTEVALTAHLVMPSGVGDDAFLHTVKQQLHDRFGIKMVTLQIVTTHGNFGR